MVNKGCTDPTHKPHAGLAGGYARLLTALQWAMNNIDPFTKEVDPSNYVKAYELAFGIKPEIKKEVHDDMP